MLEKVTRNLLLLIFICSLISTNLNARNSSNYDHTLIIDYNFNLNKRWTKVSKNKRLNLEMLFNLLKKSKAGRELLTKAKIKARKQNKTIYDIVKPGNNSLTDTTLIRKFLPSDPLNVSFESNSKVYINRDLSFIDALMDLAHELTHYVNRDSFNPYRSKFDQADFVISTIEGKGGELEAYIYECRVLLDLFPRLFKKRYRCKNIYDKMSNRFSKEKGLKEFYSLGKYLNQFKSHIRMNMTKKTPILNHFPYLNDESPTFISSVHGLPYPIAAIKEYEQVKSRSCINDQRRLLVLKKVWKVKKKRDLANFEEEQDFSKNSKDKIQHSLSGPKKSKKLQRSSSKSKIKVSRRERLYKELKKSFKLRCPEYFID